MDFSSNTKINLINCAKTYEDGTTALTPIDLEIKGGETVVFLGPSGCGKTTLLRMIAGLESPDEGGKVLFNDVDVTALPIEKRNVGMVFQSYALFPNMTVRENVAYGLKVRGAKPAEMKAATDEMLAMMHIDMLADKNVTQLSGGQRQRVALARAIAVKPHVLLLDEPLTALDALLRERLRMEIDELLRSLGITAVYVTHDQAEAMAIGDRIVVMSKGEISQIGTPSEIYRHPANAFVADFIGTINRLDRGLLDHIDWPYPEVAFRPEDIDIVPEEKAQLKAIVQSSFFLGEKTRLLVQHEKAKETVITVDTQSRTDFAIGQVVHLRVRDGAMMAFPNS